VLVGVMMGGVVMARTIEVWQAAVKLT
jgi:hypothetical protein